MRDFTEEQILGKKLPNRRRKEIYSRQNEDNLQKQRGRKLHNPILCSGKQQGADSGWSKDGGLCLEMGWSFEKYSCVLGLQVFLVRNGYK
jgi:hypothetical protein